MAIDDITLNATSIANLTLSHLGQKPLTTDIATDVAANNPSAVAINTHWGPVRNDLFREFKWPFANVIQPMQIQTGVNQDMYPEWLYFYVYTANAATVWYVFDSATVEEKEEQAYEVVYNPTLNKRVICCNVTNTSSAFNEYTYNVTDTTLWDTKFVIAFSYRLASAIAKTLTGDGAIGEKLMLISNGIISEAKRIASHEKKKKPKQSQSTINARG